MIKVLDSFTADKIAAGEVIERPVSAVKELIENSIDAGADSIIVEIRGGGKSYIRVTDNGCGIPYDEAETAFLRHATSKISSVSDLDSIGSLGFRGEALASISAVSRFTMVTRTRDAAAGIRLVIHGGRIISSEKIGANPGTSMIAEDLFYNTPARRKFMKSDAREASAVTELVQQIAVCYSHIRFVMISSGQTLFSTAGDGNVLSALKTLYPDMARGGLIPVSGENVSGYVSDPGNTRTSRKGQIFFVNGRLVSSSIIEKGLEDGYGGRIFSGFPVAALFIEADPHDIDVNIHPGKREIRFLKQEIVRNAVSGAVSRAVMTEAGVPRGFIKDTAERPVENSAPQAAADPAADTAIPALQSSEEHSAVNPSAHSDVKPADCSTELTTTQSAEYSADRHEGSRAPEDKSSSQSDLNLPQQPERSEQTSIRDFLGSLERPKKNPQASYVSESPEEYITASPAGRAAAYRPFDFDELVLKGYVFDTYIIMQSRDSLYIFDQHAAHERVFYEKFMRGYKNSSHFPQPILTSFTINVSADVYCMERGWAEDLRAMGYDIEDFGDRTFVIRGVPSYMTLEEADSFIRGYIDALDNARGANDIVIDKLIMRSCKSAVKAHDKLSEHEINELMRSLSECENPYSCPHGRPTFIKLTSYDIERSFKRK